MRRALGRAALVLGGLCVALALGEGLSRLHGGGVGDFLLVGAPSQGQHTLIVPDPQRLWKLQPGARAVVSGLEYAAEVRVNSLGLRGPDLEPPVAGQADVVVLGDSFVLGAQVPEEQVLSSRLAVALGAQTGRVVRVHNAGVDGYATRQETSWLEALVDPLRPQVAVVVFFLGNDLWENARYPERQAAAARGERGEKKAGQGVLVDALLRRSHLFARLRSAWAGWTGALPPDFRERYTQELALFTTAPPPPQVEAETAAALAGLDERCRARRLACVVALAPPAFALDPARAARTLRVYGLSPESLDLEAPARLVHRLLPSGLPAVDLAPALQAAAAAGQRPYLSYDGHWSAQGHEAAAVALAPAVAPLLR